MKNYITNHKQIIKNLSNLFKKNILKVTLWTNKTKLLINLLKNNSKRYKKRLKLLINIKSNLYNGKKNQHKKKLTNELNLSYKNHNNFKNKIELKLQHNKNFDKEREKINDHIYNSNLFQNILH